jgi:hypothetical protein
VWFGSIQIFCTIRLTDHRKKPGTAIQCKTKDSSCHQQSSVWLLRILYVETGTLLFYFVHLEVVFPEIRVYFKMLEWILLRVVLLTVKNSRTSGLIIAFILEKFWTDVLWMVYVGMEFISIAVWVTKHHVRLLCKCIGYTKVHADMACKRPWISGNTTSMWTK